MIQIEAMLAAIASPNCLFLNLPRAAKRPATLADMFRAELANLANRGEEILKNAEGRRLSPDEEREIEDLGRLSEEIDAELSKSAGRKTSPNDLPRRPGVAAAGELRASPATPGIEGRRWRDMFAGMPLAASDMGTMDFVRNVARGIYDPRLVSASQGEDSGAGGGYLVPAQTVRAVWDAMLSSSVVLPRATIFPSPTNALTVPRPDIANRSVNVAGLEGRWIAEGGTFSVDTAQITQTTFRLLKLGTLIKINAEWIEDVPTVNASLFDELVAATIVYDLDSSFFVGTGAGMPCGIINADSAVTVAKQSGQAADTILFSNVAEMVARLHPACMQNAVWYASPSVLPQLLTMSFDPGATEKTPVYLPANGAAGLPWPTLMGKPLIVTEFQPACGDKGDLILCDPSKYGVAMKPGIVLDRSDHRYFETDQVALRGKLRCDARPLWSEAHTPRNDQSMTLSWCVMLAARA